jgi:hypothetical protein
MAFSRNSVAAAVAGTLSLAALTGCPAPTAPVGGSPTPGATPTAGTPTATPTAGTPTTGPSTPASGEPTAAPSAVPSKSPLEATTVQGKVYDETGALVNTGAKIMIKSLNPSNPFETTVDVVNGNYVANNVPSGVLVEITAMRDGWTSRTKVENLLPLASVTAGGNQVNFGGTIGSSTNEDPYFISKYPEVISTEPVDEADLADSTQFTYKLTLSEALDATNQRRFAQAIRVWPVNFNAVTATTGRVAGTSNVDQATATGLTRDASLTNVVNVDTGAGFYVSQAATSYTLQEGSSFNTDSNLATVTWDASGKVATFSFKAPLKASSAGKANYAVGLLSNGESERIVDANGDQLGLSPALSGNYPAQGTTIADAFKKPTLPTLGNGLDAAGRLAATHNTVARFSVAEDDTAPVLQSVAVTGGNVITLTFSEPLIAFGGTGTPLSIGALDPRNYRIRLAEKLDDLASEKMDSSATEYPADGTTPGVALMSAMELNRTYQLNDSGTVANAFEVKVSETDPKALLLRRANFTTNAGDKFPVTAKAIRVRVLTGGETDASVGQGTNGVQDPAGNKIQSSNDSNLKSANI